ncbi:VCBS domain-containing protein, partial [Candidatus Pacearchaeota archaeon]|nr:VCBS domain-containing protein [Candidatus Pacearchaeota archaeon]
VGTEFSIDSIDDALAEGDETFSLSLADGTWDNDGVYEEVDYTGNVTTTIIDQTDFSIDSDTAEVHESALDGVDDVDPGDDIGTKPTSILETDSGDLNIQTDLDVTEYKLIVNGTEIPAAGTIITGTYGDLVITPDGSWTYTLTDNMIHSDTNNLVGQDDIEFGESFTIVVTDLNGNELTDANTPTKIDIKIWDDGPVDISPMKAFVVNSGDAAGDGVLDLAGNVGADGLASVSFTGISDGVTTLTSTGGDGVTALEGQTVYLYTSGTADLEGWTKTDGTQDVKIFSITLNEGSDTYTIDFDQKLDDESGFTVDFSEGIKQSNYDWLGYDTGSDGWAITSATADNGSTDFLFTPMNGTPQNTINVSSSGIGIGSQSLTDGTGIRIDFVEDVTCVDVRDVFEPNAFLYDQHTGVDNFTFELTQVQNSDPTAIRISVYDYDDTASTDPTDLEGFSTPSLIDISSIVVRDANETILTEGEGDDYEITVAGNYVYITGLNSVGDSVTFNGVDAFDAVKVENASGMELFGSILDGDEFDLSGFGYYSVEEGSSVNLSFDLQVTDGDGDTSSGTLNMIVMPEGDPIDASGELDGVSIIGGSGQDTLTGSNYADIITGGAEVDTIFADDDYTDIIDTGSGADIVDADLAGDGSLEIDILIDPGGEDPNAI